MARILIGLLVLLFGIVFVHPVLAQDTLLWPLPEHTHLTGGFADSRPDHFHGGVDLRTSGEHLPVVAPADGWVERFQVIPPGYGHVLYFRIADGRTVVFGHLSSFAAPIEEALRDSQEVTGTDRIDCIITQPIPRLTFHRGDELAYTGSSGVGPPHLHFEMREGAVQVDPLASFPPHDQMTPVISAVWWTPLSEYTPFTHGRQVVLPQGKSTRCGKIEATEPISFYVQAYDRNNWGRNSVPSAIRVKVNGQTVYEIFPARIDLLGARDIYGRLVLPDLDGHHRDIRRLFAVPPPPEQVTTLPAGWLSDLHDADVQIEVEDRDGNIAAVSIPVTAGEWTSPNKQPLNSCKSAGNFSIESSDTNGLAWVTPEVEDAQEIRLGSSNLGFSDRVKIRYHLKPDETQTGLYLYRRLDNGSIKPMWRLPEDTVKTSIVCFTLRGGVYGVGRDNMPPELTLSSKNGQIWFKLRDGGCGVDDATIRCKVNGLNAVADFEYEERGGYIWTREILHRGPNTVEFTAGDRAGNIQTWNETITVK